MMVLGRRSGEEELDRSSDHNPSIHLRSSRSGIKKDEHLLRKLIGLPRCREELEAMVRKVVREELNQALSLHTQLPKPSLDEAEASFTRTFKLSFDFEFPTRVFTGNKLEAEGPEGGLPLKVRLQDASTGAVVTDGPLSSMRIECVALQGDFKAEEQTSWTQKEFTENVLREREGRRPLLIGDRYVNLNNGQAFFQEVSFTDNSSWVRSKRFRLGARVAQGLLSNVGVQEAVSGAFEVRDRRGQPYQKHGTPSLEDEVWRLHKIAKDGPHSNRLAANGILTVKDFLQCYYVDESFLRGILGVSNKVWEAIVEHAKSCSLENDHYSFSTSEGVGILFNCVMNVVGVTYDAQNYQPIESLTKFQKFQVENLKRYAYENRNQLVPTDLSPSVASSPCEPVVSSNSSSFTNLQHLDLQDHTENDTSLGYSQSPYPCPFAVVDRASCAPSLFTRFFGPEPTWVSNPSAEPSSPSGPTETSTWFSQPQ